MSKPDDQRMPESTPDGTEAMPAGDDPTAGWGPSPQRPQPQSPDRPTEQFPGPQYTSNPSEAYGDATQALPAYPGYAANQPPPGATQAYPTYYDGGQPPSNPTQAYPTYPGYDANQPPPGATQAYPTFYEGGQPPSGPESGAATPAGDGEKKGPGKVVLVVAATAAVLLLAAVVGFGAMLVSSGGSDNTTASGPVTRSQAPTPARPTTPPRSTEAPQTSAPDLSKIPGGLGEAIGAAGAAVGTVRTNDGSTLILDGIGGSAVTVTTTPSTRVISLNGTRVADLRVGDTVLVQGDKTAEGAVTARLIVNTAIPDLGDLGTGGGN
jgi:hypothetical protein